MLNRLLHHPGLRLLAAIFGTLLCAVGVNLFIVPLGEFYWYISGWFLCPDCLPDFARAEYQRFRLLRGEEDAE